MHITRVPGYSSTDPAGIGARPDNVYPSFLQKVKEYPYIFHTSVKTRFL